MPRPSDPLAFKTIADQMLAAVLVRLTSPTTAGVAGAPGRACVVPGSEISWDDCCEGQLAIAITRIYGSEVPANEPGFGSSTTASPSVCGQPYLNADLLVQVIRCVPGPSDRGDPPSCAQQDAAATQDQSDRYEVRTGVCEVLRDLEAADEITTSLMQAQAAVGPEGLCAGSELRVVVTLS